MPSFGSKTRALVATLLTLSLVFVVAACAGAAGSHGGPTSEDQRYGANTVDEASRLAAEQGEVPAPGPVGGDGVTAGEGAGRGGTAIYDLAHPDLLIIKTGSIVIQVAGIDAAVDAATKTIVGLGGYASASERSGEDEDAYASVTYRVPADRWDEALAAIRGLGAKVLDERTGTQDVTGEVVDLAARIKNLQATELAFQEIMTRAAAIKDVLAVQAELTQVRGEIERLTAQKTRLEEQAALSTLAVTFSLKPNPVLTLQEKWDPGAQVEDATANLVRILQAVAAAGIWFGIVWLPILLVLGVVALVVLGVVRRTRRTVSQPPMAPDGGSV
ncbi:MAG TPA: DUF4349 domain-containing protein [Candidatus Deferrimicrobiaceae bacterium]|nr:DUF4349 domain-containing protein [Candidatus Deferrimicrobiaceae bacterium]